MTITRTDSARRARFALLCSSALVAVAASAPAFAQTTVNPAAGGTITIASGTLVDSTPSGGGVNATTQGQAQLTDVVITNSSGTAGTSTDSAYYQQSAAGQDTSVVVRGTTRLETQIDGGAGLLIAGDRNVAVLLDGGAHSFVGEIGLQLYSPTGSVSVINNGAALSLDGQSLANNGATLSTGGLVAQGAGITLDLATVNVFSDIDAVYASGTGNGDIAITTTGGSIAASSGLRANSTYAGAITINSQSTILVSGSSGVSGVGIGAISLTTSGAGTIDSAWSGGSTGVRGSNNDTASTGALSIDVGAAIGANGAGFANGIFANNLGSGGVTVTTSAAVTSNGRGIHAVANAGGANTISIGAAVKAGREALYNWNGTGVFSVTIASGAEVRGSTTAAGYTSILMTGGSLDNAGTIANGAEGMTGTGIAIEQVSSSPSDFSIINRAGGRIYGGSRAIVFRGTGNHSVQLDAGSLTVGDIVNSNGGQTTVTIRGELQGSFLDAAGTSIDTLTLEASGSITGNVQLGDGNDSFIWRGGTLAGSTDGGAGTDIFLSDLGAGNSRSLATLTGFEILENQSGTLTFTGTLASPVLVTGGTFGVAETGSILGGEYLAIQVLGADASIDNLGTIANSGNSGDGYGSAIGIFAGSGTTVINNGSITNDSAEIAAVFSAINHVAGAMGAVVVNNYGLIHADTGIENPATTGALTINNYAGGRILGEGIGGYSAAISHGSGELLTVANAGTVAGTDFGISAIGPVTLSNSGTIRATWGSGVNLSGNISLTANTGTISGLPFGIYSIATTGTNSITNDAGGTISGNNGIGLAAATTVNNGGTISGAGSAGTGVHLVETSTVTNSGSIIGGAGGTGVHFGNGGIVTNNAGASISSGGIGINVLGAAATITNRGSISSGSGYTGVYLDKGGSLINSSGATISAGTGGVDVRGAAGTIDNYGTITAGNAPGIMLSAGGTATNYATINASGNNSTGLRSTGAASTLDNRGTITANIGIRTDAAGSTLRNSGTINATSFAIYVPSGTATLINSGNVNGSVGATLNGGGSITNSGSLVGTSYGITSAGSATTVVNDGTISGGSGAISLSTFNDTVTLNSSSTTIGSISLSSGNDTLTIMTGATFGALAGGSGSDTLVLGGAATGTLNLASVTTFEILNKTGTGTWTLDGAAASPAMAITAGNGVPSGTLAFTGTGLTGTINVNGATIRALSAGAFGTGTINAIDPTIEYGATGTYANPIVLQSIDPANDPTRLAADAGVTATLTGQISQVGAQRLVIGGLGTIALTSTSNAWSDGTTIESGATLIASVSTIGSNSATVTNQGTLVFDEPAGAANGPAITGSGALIKRGAGTLNLGSGSNYSGATTIEAGTLSLSSAASLSSSSAVRLASASAVLDTTTLMAGGLVLQNLSGVAGSQVHLAGKSTSLANSADTLFEGTLTTTAAQAGAIVTKTGPGSLALTGDTSGVTMPVAISEGALLLVNSASLGGASYVSLAGGTLDVSGVSAATTSLRELRGSGGTVSLGSKTLNLTAGANNPFGGTITGTGGVTVTSGVANFAGVNTYSGATTISQPGAIFLSGNGSLANSDVTVNGSLQALGGATSVRSLSGAASGNTYVSGQTLSIANGGSYAGSLSGAGTLSLTGGTLVLTGNTSVATIRLDGGNLTLGNGSNAGALFGTQVVLNGGTYTHNLLGGGTVSNVTGAGDFVKAGAGNVYLSDNSFVGTATIAAGTATLTGASALADTTDVIVAAGAVLDVADEETIGSLSGSGRVDLNAPWLEIGTGSTFAGLITDGTGMGNGLRIASGTEILTADNLYIGETTLLGSANLVLGDGGTTGSVAGTIAVASGTVTVNRSNDYTIAARINGNGQGGGNFVQAGTGTTYLTNFNTFEGSAAVNAGTLSLAGGMALYDSVAVTVAQGATLALADSETVGSLSGAGAVTLGSNTLTMGNGGMFSGVAAGTGGITVTGGTLLLSGDNLYTGATTLAGGNLTLGDGGTTGSVAGAIAVDAGTLTLNRSDAVTLANPLSGDGNIVLSGSGATRITGTNSFSGIVTAIGGDLTLVGENALGSDATIAAAAGRTLTLEIASGAMTRAGAITGGAALIKTGAGNATLSGANSFTGDVAITGGTLAVSGGSAIGDGAGVSIADGATFQLLAAEAIGGLSGTGAVDLGGTLILAAPTAFGGTIGGTGGVTIVSGTQLVTGDWTYTGATTLLGGASLTVGDGGTTGSVGGPIAVGTGTVTANRSDLLEIAGLTGGGAFVQAGGGETRLGGSGAYQGSVTVLNGTLTLDNPGALALAQSVDLAGSTATLNSSGFAQSTIRNLSGVAGSQINIGAKGLRVDNSASTLFAGTLNSGGAGPTPALVKTGAGTLTLTGQNALDELDIMGGTVALSGAGSFGDNAYIYLENGSLDLSGVTSGATTFASLAGGMPGDVVSLGSTALTLTNGQSSFFGLMEGTGNVAITGGLQSFGAANTYSGGTRIGAGATLALVENGAIVGDVQVDGTFDLIGLYDSTSIGGLSGSGTVLLGEHQLALTANGSFAGKIANDPAGDPDYLGGLRIASGTTTLTGTNGLTGTTTVDNGATLALAGAGSLAGSAVIVDGTLDITGANAAATIASLSGGGSVLLGARTLALGGNNADSDFSGVIAGSGGLTKTGAGVLTLSGANTYSGLTRVAGGTLRLGASEVLADDSSLEILGGATLDLNGFDETVRSFSLLGNLIGAGSLTAAEYRLYGGTIEMNLGAGAVYQLGGTTLLNGTAAGSAVHVEVGTLQLGASDRLADGAIITVLSGATLDLQGFTDTVGALALAGTLAGSGTLTATTYTLDNATVAAGLGTGTLIQQSGISSLSGASTLDAAQINGGTLALAGAASLGGTAVTMNGGTLDFAGAASASVGSLAGTGGVALGANTLAIATGATFAGAISGNGGVTIAAGTQVFTANQLYAGTTTLAGGNLTLRSGGSVSGDIAIGQNILTIERSDAVTLAGAISGTGTLVQAGTGTTTLSGANDFAGAVAINAGGLTLAGGNALGDTAAVTVDTAARLTLAASETIGSLSGSGAVALGDNRLTLATGGRFDGVASGSGGVTIAAGTQLLTADNFYTGTTTLGGAANLTLGSGGNAGAVAGDIVLGTGTLTVDRGDTLTLAQAVSGAGRFVQAGAGTTILAGANSYSGGTSVAAGTLRIGDGGTSGSLTGDIAVAASLVFDRSDATGFAGMLSGTGSVTAAGGVLTLSGDSSGFTGTTSVQGGGLRVTGALGSNVLVGSGTISGTGSIAGSVTIENGARLGGSQGTTLALGALALDAGAIVDAALGAPAAGATLFAVGGDLVLDGTLNVTDAGGFGAGVYRLFDYGGTLTDNGLAIGSAPGDAAGRLAVQTSVAGRINLISFIGTDLNFWDGGDAARFDNNSVDGGAGTWSAGGRNWTSQSGAANGPMLPQPGFAVFQGSGGTVTIDDAAGAVSATGMQFAADGYTLTGGALALSGERATIRVGDGTSAGAAFTATIAAALTGTSTLVKSDLGTLVLTGANSYTGGTIVEAGTLVGDAASIRGDLQNAGTIVFAQATDASFAGTISGSGALVKSGAGALTLAGASSSNWAIDAGSLVSTSALFTGNVQIAQSASLVFDQNANGSYAGAISGAGNIVFRGGGTVQLTGNSAGYQGVTTVGGAGGASLLSVNGTLGGMVDVLAGARLQGIGTIGGGRISGTIAPGNSIGTLTVSGNLTFNPGSVFEVEANAAGQSDRINAGGSVSILGGTVSVLAANGSYAANTDYTIVSASGGVTGTFAGVTSNLAFLTPSLRYAANAVTLQLARNTVDFAAVVQTPNQGAVAPAVQALGTGNAVYEAVVSLSADQARSAFDQLAASDHASVRGALVEDSGFVRDAVLSRRASAGSEGVAIWGQLLGSWRDMDGSANAAGYNRSIEGLLTGFDGSLGTHWRAGVALGYGTTELRTATTEHEADSVHAGGYLLGAYGPVTVQLGGAYAWNDIRAQRRIAFAGFNQVAADKYQARTFQTFGEVAVRHSLGGLDLQPFLGLAHVTLFDAEIAEHGSAAAVQGGAGNFDATFGTLGLRAGAGFALGGIDVRLDGSAAVKHAFGDRVPTIDLRFATGPGFSVSGVPIERDSIAADAGLSVALSQRLTLGVSYTGSYGDRSTDHGARARLSWQF